MITPIRPYYLTFEQDSVDKGLIGEAGAFALQYITIYIVGPTLANLK